MFGVVQCGICLGECLFWFFVVVGQGIVGIDGYWYGCVGIVDWGCFYQFVDVIGDYGQFCGFVDLDYCYEFFVVEMCQEIFWLQCCVQL